MSGNRDGARVFLFLQGPTNLLFAGVAQHLRRLGHRTCRIHVCAGDHLFWRGPKAVRFVGRVDEWPDFISRFYRENGVTDLVLLGEQRHLHRVAIDLARPQGIEVAVTDFGYLRPDWVILERDGLNAESRFERDPQALLQLAKGLPPISRSVLYRDNRLNQALWDMAFHLSSALLPWFYPHFRRHTLRHPILTYLSTGLRLSRAWGERRRARALAEELHGDQAYYLFAMQMEDDFSVRAYSSYPDLDAAMDEVVRSFAAHAPRGAWLVFKLHPLDPGFKPWRRRIRALAERSQVAERVHFVDGGDLDELIQGSAGVLSINSTVGIRALELGRPTLALGQAIYRIRGLAFDGAVDAFWTEGRAPDAYLVDAFLRLLAASLHVRGGMYDHRAIAAAAEGIAFRLHHRLVNHPLHQVLLGEPLHIRGGTTPTVPTQPA